MKLIPFQKAHIQTLIDWITDEDTMLRFAGVAFTFPLTQAQLEDYIQQNPDRLMYLAVDASSNPLGYGEIIPQGDGSARLAHLIIGEKAQRAKGLGQQLIRLLNLEAQRKLKIKTMDLYLLDGNVPAEKCYLKYGFHFVKNDFQIFYQEQAYDILKMTIAL